MMAAASIAARSHHTGPASRSTASLTSLSDGHRNSGGSMPKTVGTLAGKEQEKPVASANGIACFVELAEPHVYLTGFDHEGRGTSSQNSAALIRGSLVLVVTKSVKLKAVTLSFYGKARTEWPEGIPPQKTVFFEEEKLRHQVMPFYNAMFADSDNGYGAQCEWVLKNNVSSTNLPLDTDSLPPSRNSVSAKSIALTGKEQKRLSLQANQSRSFQKGEPGTFGATPQQKGYKIFHPGRYEYSFEISLDHTCPETMNLPLGSVHWMLEALIERAGTFKPNLHGIKDVTIVRAPDQNSMEQVEPIAISRKWEDQLHYEIVISGKSFPIGSKIPIAFKLTPLAKVQCHRIKVFITENIDYFCMDKKVARKDSQRKILLLERQAGKPVAKEYVGSNVEIRAGGEKGPEERERSRRMAEARRRNEANLENREPDPLPPPVDNLLGDLDLGLEHLISATEIEMEVQLPTCAKMAKDRTKIVHPDTTWKNIQVHHWIKIVMRLSRSDTEDPTKRRHFEISIDSPFHILSCLATQAHTALPRYSGATPNVTSNHGITCGCDDSVRTNSSTPSSSSGSVPTLASIGSSHAQDSSVHGEAIPALTVPPQAHLATNGADPMQRPPLATNGLDYTPRPMHMLRAPSFNPPPFEAEESPPPVQTPPPMYDHVVGTPSVDGLADYFARLADFDEDHIDDNEFDDRAFRNGRVNVVNPRTSGSRTVSRSMDIDRDFMFRPENFDSRLRNATAGSSQTNS